MRFAAVLAATLLSCSGASQAATPADTVYRNAVIFTADAGSRQVEALAVTAGRIVHAGSAAEVQPFVGEGTRQEDLAGRFVMPGLIDAHMHPFEAGGALLKCNLEYAALTVPQLQQRVKACLDATEAEGPDAWLLVVAWFQENMLPPGVRTSRADLDALSTTRPIIIRSSFGHTVLANSRALALGGITRDTKDPLGGKIWRDANGEPTGLLEDAAYEVFSTLVPPPTPEQNRKAAEAALAMMASQGVTGFLDAAAGLESIEAFSAVHAAGGLTARGHFAVAIDPKEGADPAAAVARVVDVSRRHDGGAPEPAPGIRVRNAKLFLDGVIAAPALTGTMLEPYRVNAGTADAPRWVPGSSRGPEPYFPAAPLAAILTGLGSNGINPHIHADGDGAVRAALDGYESMRKALPGKDIRAAIAHNEIVSEQDRPRYRALDVIPVLSMQWGKPAGDTLGLVDIFGPERMAMIEPAGLLAAHGARVAFGSDWPVDALDEWFALKVGVTRSNRPDADPAYRGRLGKDPGLSAEAVLRAATINAAYSLHDDGVTGSLEAGKFADFIVLDRNPLTIPPEDIANVKVLRTVVGGKTVYEAPAR